MTIITFQSRIHFASNVLEEALRAELEENGHANALIILDAEKENDISAHRVLMGIPDSVGCTIIKIGDGQTKYETAELATSQLNAAKCDVIIANGSARAIAHGRKCRQAYAQARYAKLKKSEQKYARIRPLMPDFFAIPGIDGLPDPCMSAGSAVGEKTSPPTVIICDPTLVVDVSDEDVASAFAATLGRCLATFGGSSFNPLADGMAVEGLRRLKMLTPFAASDARRGQQGRDLMAASLNGSISQQKGPGFIQALANTLNAISNKPVDSGALQRILLPRLLKDSELVSETNEALVLRILDVDPNDQLSDGIANMLDPLPLATELRDLGYTLEEMKKAANAARSRTPVSDLSTDNLNSILEDLY